MIAELAVFVVEQVHVLQL